MSGRLKSLAKRAGSRLLSFAYGVPFDADAWRRGSEWRQMYSTAAGIPVSEETAIQIAAVQAAVRLRSEIIASLPLITYRRRRNGTGKDRATDHPVYAALHDEPNRNCTSFTWRQTGNAQHDLWGNWYAPISRTGGRGVSLDLWHPMQVAPDRTDDGEVFYRVRIDGSQESFSRDEVIHVPGLGFDGLKGFSRIAAARNALGLAQATEEFGSALFQNGVKASGVLEHPGKLSKEAHQRLSTSVNQEHGGRGNWLKLLILEEGMKWNQQSIPPEDAQFLETRKFQISEIARIFGVPPHLLGDLERATFSNIEQQSLEFLIYHLLPTLKKIEQELNRKLFRPTERGTYFVEFLFDGLLRGDIESRYTAYATAVNNGWMNPNEVRERENMNPYLGGDEYRRPMNEEPVGRPN